MDIDTRIKRAERGNRKLFGAMHHFVLVFAFFTLVVALMVFIDPMIGVACSGFVAFFLNYYYSQHTFKQLNTRISLLQRKVERMGK